MNKWLIYAFLLGLGTRLQVQVIGYLPLSEVAILCLTPFLLPQLTARENRFATRWTIPLAALWALSVVVCDIWNGVDWSLFARGFARPLIIMLCIPFFCWFMRDDTARRLTAFYLGMIPSVILSAYVLRGGVHEGREFLYGTAQINWETHWAAIPGLMSVVAAIVFYKRLSFIGYGSGVALGALNILNGSRASGAITILGPVVCLSRNLVAGRSRLGKARGLSAMRAATLIVLVSFGLYGTVSYYTWLVKSDQVAERHVKKFEKQSSSRFGLLFGGRPEFVVASMAIKKSPFIGYGSWAKDEQGFYMEACQLLEIEPNMQTFRQGLSLLSSHSHILQAWVENGIAGGIFWAYALWIIGLHLYKPMRSEETLRLWGSTMAVSLGWAILFSPISERVAESLALAVMMREMMPICKRPAVGGYNSAAQPRPVPSRDIPTGEMVGQGS
jgi:hypothetical protein